MKYRLRREDRRVSSLLNLFLQFFCSSGSCDDNAVRPFQTVDWFTQPSGRQEPAVAPGIGRVDRDDIEVARLSHVLETVVEDQKVSSKVLNCPNGAGHAIGTEVHEPPFLIATSAAPLREGMIFTVEPGIYDSERGGIRLEDDILVSADGPVNLSPYPLELRIL